jgi:hypothetical protein
MFISVVLVEIDLVFMLKGVFNKGLSFNFYYLSSSMLIQHVRKSYFLG